MIRSTWTLAFLLVTLFVPARAAESEPGHPHIRSDETELLDSLAQGARVSPTLNRLVDRLERSDVVVYLMFDRTLPRDTAGRISFITTIAGRRYLRISIDRRQTGCQRIAILGHELQHAAEIADEPWVTDHEGVAALYRGIGFRSNDRHDHRFDSRLAIDTGRQVLREVLAAPALGRKPLAPRATRF